MWRKRALAHQASGRGKIHIDNAMHAAPASQAFDPTGHVTGPVIDRFTDAGCARVRGLRL